MKELWWIGLAWLLFGLAVLVLIKQRQQSATRQFAYEPRAALLREAIEKQWSVRFVYWSQVEHRWLRRSVQPVSLASGHLRAADPKTGQSRRYEVTRMRTLKVQSRRIAPPWSWHLPLAAVLAAAAVGLSGYALWERTLAQAATAKSTVALPEWWRAHDPQQVTALKLHPDSVSLADATVITIAGEPAAVAPDGVSNSTWQVLLLSAPEQSLPRVVAALQRVFLQARPQALYLARQSQIQGQVAVWQGSASMASNYVGELVRLGLLAKAQAVQPSP